MLQGRVAHLPLTRQGRGLARYRGLSRSAAPTAKRVRPLRGPRAHGL